MLLLGDVVYLRLATTPDKEYAGYVVVTVGGRCLLALPDGFWRDCGATSFGGDRSVSPPPAPPTPHPPWGHMQIPSVPVLCSSNAWDGQRSCQDHLAHTRVMVVTQSKVAACKRELSDLIVL